MSGRLRLERLLSGWRECRREWIVLTLAAIVLFCVRIPFLPATLDDIDSINFDLGIHDYNPVAHRPHPPGYPVFIGLAKLTHPLFASHAAALAFLSVVFGSLAVFPLYFLMRQLTSRAGAALACVLTLANPLVWFNSVRPMSDLTGFFFVLASQCLLLKGTLRMEHDADAGRRLWRLGVVAAGLAIGVRLQAVLLVGPVLLYGWIRHRQVRLTTAGWLAGSVAAWAVPLVALSGGPTRYVQSLTLLISDALPVEPLLSGPTIHRAVFALWDVVGAPWGPPWLAIPILLCGALGAVLWIVSNGRALLWAMLLFLPYALYHYLLQFSPTIRYAIPIVPLVALLAAVPFVHRRKLSPLVLATLGLAFVAVSSMWTGGALAAYHHNPSPAAQALAHVQSYAAASGDFVISGNHVFARYLSMLRADFQVLPSVPRRAWHPLAEYWKGGGRKPVLFLRNPMRTSLLLVGRDTQTTLGRWSWPPAVRPLMKGERPSTVELVRLDPPRWFCETGFFVTGEAGEPDEVARQEHRVYVRHSSGRRSLIASGSLPESRETHVTLRVGDRVHRRWRIDGDFTLRTMLDPIPGSDYVPLSFVSPAPVLFTDAWVEREDRSVIRPASGFYSPERDSQAKLFRWMAPEAQAVTYLSGKAARVRIRGRIPVKYYQLPVKISLEWDGNPLASFLITTADFDFESIVSRPVGGEPWGMLTVRSSHHFVPDEWQKSGDLRVLAAQIYELSLTAVPDPAPASHP